MHVALLKQKENIPVFLQQALIEAVFCRSAWALLYSNRSATIRESLGGPKEINFNEDQALQRC